MPSATTQTGEPQDASGTTGARPTQNPFGGNFFLLIILLLGAMIAFSMWGARRDRKKREAVLRAVKKHDKVQTVGGVIGSVVEVKSDLVVLKVDEASNTRITFARSSIQQVLGPATEELAPPALEP